MRKTVRTAPDADQKLLDDLQRLVASVGAGLRQIPSLGRLAQFHALEHPPHQGQTAPGGDLAIRESHFVVGFLVYRHFQDRWLSP